MDFVKGQCPGCARLATALRELREKVEVMDKENVHHFTLLQQTITRVDQAAEDLGEDLRRRIDALEPYATVSDTPPATPLLDEMVRNLCDLNTWDETEGCGSLDGVKCPHCSALQEGDFTGKQGEHICDTCSCGFRFEPMDTPDGTAWLSWKDTKKAEVS